MINSSAEKEKDISKLVQDYIVMRGLEKDNIAISLHVYNDDMRYNYNGDNYFTAASTYKLYQAVIYYDLINEGSKTLDDLCIFRDYMNQYGDIGDKLNDGDKVKIGDLLSYSIIDSDNTASYMLFENLGGWKKLKELASKYSKVSPDDSQYYSMDNIVKSNFLMDFLDRIYYNQNNYAQLMEYLGMAQPYNYLNLDESMHNKFIQKYGSYDGFENAAGILLEDRLNYSLVILTSYDGRGEGYIGELSKLIYDYLRNKY